MSIKATQQQQQFDIAVIGASLGGVQAALKAAKQGKRVYLCEETDWIGGQLTTQAVPPDEHRWIERFGATKSYLRFREEVRAHYRSLPNISDALTGKQCFCPGNSWVSRVSHEPKVALAILESYLKPHLDSGAIVLDYETVAVAGIVENDVISSVTVENTKSGVRKVIHAAYFLDATDCGELLPVVGAEYRIGAECKAETGEPHAPDAASPSDMQPITWVCALELDPDGDYKIDKPDLYDFFHELIVPYDDNKLFSWYGPDAHTQSKKLFSMFDGDLGENSLGLWSYRRIIDSRNYKTPVKQVSLINWPQNDFYLGNIYEDGDAQKKLYYARQQTLCFVYWLQNEAPRADGGKGYPVKLRGDIMGTEDGLAKAPYIRESRRIVAKKTICEQDVSKRCNDAPPTVSDSVGVGHYAIDIHLTTQTHTFLYDATYPFEIPLSAMVPVRLQNLIPACKNIGCTHLTNGCYRLHPVEWNVGESAGLLASYCIDHGVTPAQVADTQVSQFQAMLEQNGIQLHWDYSEMGL